MRSQEDEEEDEEVGVEEKEEKADPAREAAPSPLPPYTFRASKRPSRAARADSNGRTCGREDLPPAGVDGEGDLLFPRLNVRLVPVLRKPGGGGRGRGERQRRQERGGDDGERRRERGSRPCVAPSPAGGGSAACGGPSSMPSSI